MTAAERDRLLSEQSRATAVPRPLDLAAATARHLLPRLVLPASVLCAALLLTSRFLPGPSALLTELTLAAVTLAALTLCALSLYSHRRYLSFVTRLSARILEDLDAGEADVTTMTVTSAALLHSPPDPPAGHLLTLTDNQLVFLPAPLTASLPSFPAGEVQVAVAPRSAYLLSVTASGALLPAPPTPLRPRHAGLLASPGHPRPP